MCSKLRFVIAVAILSLTGAAQARDAKPIVAVPTCTAVCVHIMELALVGVPDDEKAAVQEAGKEVLKECVPQCEEELDGEARSCFMKAGKMEDGDACDKALLERRK